MYALVHLTSELIKKERLLLFEKPTPKGTTCPPSTVDSYLASLSSLFETLPIFSIPWGHNILLLQKVKDANERIWYASKTIEHGWSRSMRAFEILTPPNPDYVQLINALNVPSLLVVGGIGSVISLGMATELAGLNPCLKVVQVAEAGHAIPYDQPDHLSAVIQVFLGSLVA